MMIGQLTFKSTLQLGNLAAKFALGQIGENGNVLVSRQKRLNHLTSRGSQHITGDRPQFDVGRLQHFLNRIIYGVSLLNEFGQITCQFTQFALLPIRDKTRLQKPRSEEHTSELQSRGLISY